MKIKSLLLSLFLFPVVLFGATNVFDNTIIRVSEHGIGKMVWTNGVDGTVTNYLGGNAIYSRKTDDAFFDFISTNNIRVGRIGWDAVNNGINIGTSNIDLTFSENLGQLNLFSGNFTWLINNHTSSSGVTIVHNGEVGMFSNVTMGVFSGNTITINGTTVTAPNTLNINANTLWITNGGVAVGTNSMPATIAFLSQVNAATQVPIVGRGFVGQSADLFSLQSSIGGISFSVSSSGTIDTISGNASASLSASGLTLINNTGTANVLNNGTGAAILNVGGGSGASSGVTISASGSTLANFTTNTITLSQPTFINSGLRVKRVQTGTNYTLRATDYYIAVKGTTATVVTNFLPAAGGNVGSGTSFIIKDAQQSAATTNIVIMPSGGDTIDNAASQTIIVNGDAQLLIFDGVSNWETGNL